MGTKPAWAWAGFVLWKENHAFSGSGDFDLYGHK